MNGKASCRTKPAMGGRISRVLAGGVGARAGLRAGDVLLAINGRPVRDIIDVQFLSADEILEFTFQRQGRTYRRRVQRSYKEPLGLEFVEPLFDGIRECENHCPFCFVRQLPAGLRRSLYIQDDDYRLSFLNGSFVTLTNLTQEDWQRLEEQRLSPLYVSVHATEPALRERLLGRRGLEPIMVQLRRLIDLGIVVHTQVVVIPELNDGPALVKTVEDLASLSPGVASIGVVPVGLTRFQRGRLHGNTPAEAERVLAQTDAWQAHYRRQLGVGLVYASDEWYLMAGRPVPASPYYDGYPQLQNGIGLVRQLLDDWDEIKEHVTRQKWAGEPVYGVCGTLIAPLLQELLAEFAQRSGVPIEIKAVKNRFFGETVTVSGLLTAGDVVETLRSERWPIGRLFLPRSMFDAEGRVTLDDWTLSDIEKAVDAPAVTVENVREMAKALGTWNAAQVGPPGFEPGANRL